MSPSRGAYRAGLGCLVLFATVARGAAASPPSQPDYVVKTGDGIASPRLLADSEGGLHLFYLRTSSPGPSKSVTELVYRKGNGESWSAAVAILERRGSGIGSLVAALDPSAWLHVLLSGQGGELSHISVHVSQAEQPRQWSARHYLPDTAARAFDLAISEDGVLHLVYADLRGDVVFRASADGGGAWSERVVIARLSPGEVSNLPRLALGGRGRVYATWTQHAKAKGWGPSGVYFSASADSGRHWTAPWRAAEDRGNSAVGVDRDEELHLTWSDLSECGEQRFLLSADGGGSWAAVDAVASSRCGFAAGPNLFLSDGTQKLHLVIGAVDREHPIFRVSLRSREREEWSAPVELSSGRARGRAAAEPAAALRLGNDLHVVFVVAGGGLAHTSIALPGARLAARPVPPLPALGWLARLSRLSPQAWLLIAVLGLLAIFRARRCWAPRPSENLRWTA